MSSFNPKKPKDKSVAGKVKVKDINAKILIKSVSRLGEMVVKVLAE